MEAATLSAQRRAPKQIVWEGEHGAGITSEFCLRTEYVSIVVSADLRIRHQKLRSRFHLAASSRAASAPRQCLQNSCPRGAHYYHSWRASLKFWRSRRLVRVPPTGRLPWAGPECTLSDGATMTVGSMPSGDPTASDRRRPAHISCRVRSRRIDSHPLLLDRIR